MSDAPKQTETLEPLMADRLDALLRAPFLDADEVAILLRTTHDNVWNARRTGALKPTKIGKFIRFSRRDVDAYLAALANGSP